MFWPEFGPTVDRYRGKLGPTSPDKIGHHLAGFRSNIGRHRRELSRTSPKSLRVTSTTLGQAVAEHLSGTSMFSLRVDVSRPSASRNYMCLCLVLVDPRLFRGGLGQQIESSLPPFPTQQSGTRFASYTTDDRKVGIVSQIRGLIDVFKHIPFRPPGAPRLPKSRTESLRHSFC